MPQEIQNKDLYLKKESLLKENPDLTKNTYKTSCYYHGIHLTFFATREAFVNELNSLIPNSWKTDIEAEEKIFLIDPLNLGFEGEDFSDEASQDCYEINNQAIQRDFAAITNNHTTYLYTHETIWDGFNNFLRWFLPRRLLKKDCYVLHSSCVIGKDGRAHFFLGHSGAGKTTVTSLCGDRAILGDDMNLIIKEGNEFYAMPGAIGGLFFKGANYDQKYPIGDFHWLTQSNQDKITPLSPIQATSKLTASISNIFWSNLSDQYVDQILGFSSEVATSFPFNNLDFRKSKDFWSLIDGK